MPTVTQQLKRVFCKLLRNKRILKLDHRNDLHWRAGLGRRCDLIRDSVRRFSLGPAEAGRCDRRQVDNGIEIKSTCSTTQRPAAPLRRREEPCCANVRCDADRRGIWCSSQFHGCPVPCSVVPGSCSQFEVPRFRFRSRLFSPKPNEDRVHRRQRNPEDPHHRDRQLRCRRRDRSRRAGLSRRSRSQGSGRARFPRRSSRSGSAIRSSTT